MNTTKSTILILLLFVSTVMLSFITFSLTKEIAKNEIKIKNELYYLENSIIANLSKANNNDSMLTKIAPENEFIIFIPEQACSTCYNEFVKRINEKTGKHKILLVVEVAYMKNNFSSYNNVRTIPQDQWPCKFRELPYLLIKKKQNQFIFLYDESKLDLLDDILSICI